MCHEVNETYKVRTQTVRFNDIFIKKRIDIRHKLNYVLGAITPRPHEHEL